METTLRILRYLLAIIVVALLGGIASWYFFVRSHETATSAVDAARGLDNVAPAYGGTFGSTASNMEGGAATSSAPQQIVRLWRADQGPVAGFSFIAEPVDATSSADIDFAERANGYVFDANATMQTVMRLTDTLIPKTYEAVFAPAGGTVLVRTLDQGSITTLLASFASTASTTTFPQHLSGPTLPNGIRALAVSPDPSSSELFYLAPGASGGVAGMLGSLSNAKPTQLFSSPITSWRTMIANGAIVLLESPADNLPGYAYTLSKSGALLPLLGPLPGLMVLPHPSENALLYSTSSGGGLALYAQVGNAAPVLLPIRTVAEKCAWMNDSSLIAYCAVPQSAPASDFVGAWYQGDVHTSDAIWEIDASNGTATEVYTPQQNLDVRDPQMDPSGTYLAFENGSDMSLWVLRVVQ